MWFGFGKEGHGGFGEVAAVGGLPSVVGFDQDRAGQPQQRFGVGEDADDVGAAFDFLVQPIGFVDQTFFQCPGGKRANARMS